MRNFDILMTNLFSFSTRATRMQTMIIKINSKLPRPSRITSSFVLLMSLPSRLPIEAQTFITIILRTWVLLNSRNMNFYELFFFELYFKEKIMKSVHEVDERLHWFSILARILRFILKFSINLMKIMKKLNTRVHSTPKLE